MSHTVHTRKRSGKTEKVYSGTPHAAATAFFKHLALVSVMSPDDPDRHAVYLIGPDGKKVAHGSDMHDIRREWDFIGYSDAARLSGILRAMPLSVSSMVGVDRSRILSRAAAEGRSLPKGFEEDIITAIEDIISRVENQKVSVRFSSYNHP